MIYLNKMRECVRITSVNGCTETMIQGGMLMSNISGNAYGAAAYSKADKWWNAGKRKDLEKATGSKANKGTGSIGKADGVTSSSSTTKTDGVTDNNNVKTSVWSKKGSFSVPVPSYSEDYGTVIGEVSLSKEASDYYNSLKAKYGDMEFILVSKDQKAAVQANVSRYGNAKKPVVLIDDERLERMATDEDFRKKYEGIIAMAQNQLSSMKNDLSSSGAAVKNFGMSVSEDGTTSFFAVMEKSSKQQAERLEKKREEKAEAKKEAKKAEAKKAAKKKAEEKAEAKKAEKKEREEKLAGDDEDTTVERHERVHRSYTEYSSNSLEDLVSAVKTDAYARLESSVITDAEKVVGQSIDFKG